jgi:ribosome-binding factor A
MPQRRRGAQRTTARDYPRTARLNELLREIIGEELERIDDDRLDVVTVISVDTESDLRRAVVYYDCLDGEAGDEDALAALGDARIRLQRAIGRQARFKRTPELRFLPDPAVRSGARIEAVLADIGPIPEVEVDPEVYGASVGDDVDGDDLDGDAPDEGVVDAPADGGR